MTPFQGVEEGSIPLSRSKYRVQWAAMKSTPLHPTQVALTGLLFALPFILANFVVALRLQPLYTWLGSVETLQQTPVLPLLLLLLFPVGAFVAARPLLEKDSKGKRQFYILNAALATTLIVLFVVMFSALGEEIYRCEVLHIPNCD